MGYRKVLSTSEQNFVIQFAPLHQSKSKYVLVFLKLLQIHFFAHEQLIIHLHLKDYVRNESFLFQIRKFLDPLFLWLKIILEYQFRDFPLLQKKNMELDDHRHVLTNLG